MQERVYHTLIRDEADLRQKVMSSSAGFQITVVDEASGKRDSTPVFVHKEVTSNTALTQLVACFMTALNVLSQ